MGETEGLVELTGGTDDNDGIVDPVDGVAIELICPEGEDVLAG